MKTTLNTILAGMLFCCFSLSAWEESFNGKDIPPSTSAYHQKQEPHAELRVADGVLRVVLPGKKKLEGVRVIADKLQPARLTTTTVRVRGQGEAWLCLTDGKNWLYAPTTLALTKDWQEIRLRRGISRTSTTLSVNLLSKTVQPSAIFEIDSITVEQEADPALSAVPVPPLRFEAEDFSHSTKCIQEFAGTTAIAASGYVSARQIPLPRNQRPIVIRARVYAASTEDTFRLLSRIDGMHALTSCKAETFGEWSWIQFPSILFGETGGTFEMDLRRRGRAGEMGAIDAIVICSEDQLQESPESAMTTFAPEPLIQVARCQQAPVLDGRDDDPCWQTAVTAKDFLLGRSQKPAEEDTSVRFTYDDSHFYAHFVCQESRLGVAQQRQHEFRAKESKRDGRVYKDSACLLMLDPQGDGKRFYEIGANALGTVIDACCDGPSYWTSRDLGWNADVRCASQRGDGFWTLELAIPFRDLGAPAPTPGKIWQIIPGRIAAARKENSSWSPSGAGFHDPLFPGKLLFAETTPGLALNSPERWQPGANQFSVESKQKTEPPLLAGTSLKFEKRIQNNWSTIPPAPKKHPLEVLLRDEGEVQVQQGIFSSATLAPIYRRPRIKTTVRSQNATLTLSGAGAFNLFLNGDLLTAGNNPDNLALKVPLARGANTIALRVEQGKIRARLSCPGTPDTETVWKINPKPDDKSILPKTNDSTWETAKPDPEGNLGHGVGPMVLRHTLIWESTRVWPAPKPALFIARGIPQQLISVFNPEGRKLRNWSFYLSLPDGFRLVGSTSFYAKHRENYPQFVSEPLGTREENGEQRKLYRINATAPLPLGGHMLFSTCTALIEASTDAKLDQPYELRYWTRANDETWAEMPQSVPIRVLPELKGKQPQKLTWQIWGSFFGPMDDLEVKQEYLRLFQAVGFNDLVAGDTWTGENAPKFGIHNTYSVKFVSWSINISDHLKAHPDQQLLDSNGKQNPACLCTSRLLTDEGWKPVHASLEAMIAERKVHTIDYDFEYSPFTGPHSCYCPRCLTAFRDYAKIAPHTPLSPAEIKTTWRKQWIDFMANRVAQVFLRLRQSVNHINPDGELSIYSGYHGPGNAEQYGVDWEKVGELQACDKVGCGYGRPAERVRGTVGALQGIPLICGAIVTPYDYRLDEPLVPLTVPTLLRRSLDSTGGVLVYNRVSLDGRCWLAIAETTRLVATYEELFLNGKRSSLEGQSEENVVLLGNEDEQILFLLNPSSKKQTFNLSAPFNGQDFYSKRRIRAGEEETFELQPGTAFAFVKTP